MISFSGLRIAPAKKILCLSLFEMLESAALESISTKVIYERVGISANSFYYHFRDKYDCASYLLRMIILRAQSIDSSPETLYSDMVATHPIFDQFIAKGYADGTPAYSLMMEHYHEMWYSMAVFVRNHARLPFLNIYRCRETNSPYYDLRSTYDQYFDNCHYNVQFKNPKYKIFLKEALFSFYELYLINFALNPDYDFQEIDAKRLTLIRKKLYETSLASFQE